MSPRMPADQRRQAVLRAARVDLGMGGFVGTSTDSIARRVGVSQPYLFRLFPTKRAIFVAAIEGCFDRLDKMFELSSEGLTGEEALHAMGRAYNALLDDKTQLQLQLHMWATACYDD